MQKPKVSIVLLVYNQAHVIERVLNDFNYKIVKKLPESELIVAEDGSNDGTKEVLSNMQKKIRFRLISGKVRKGYIKAYKDAMGYVKNDIILFSDSDGEFDP